MSENNTPDNPGGRAVLVVLGAVLILFGLGNIGETVGIGRILAPFGWSTAAVRDWMLALGALVGGILLIVFATRGGTTFRMPTRSDRLYRSRDDKMISGVIGGLAEYFGMEPTLLRLAVVALAFLTEAWPVLVIYIAASIIVPVAPEPGAPAAVSQPLATPQPLAPSERPAPTEPPAPTPPAESGEPQ